MLTTDINKKFLTIVTQIGEQKVLTKAIAPVHPSMSNLVGTLTPMLGIEKEVTYLIQSCVSKLS